MQPRTKHMLSGGVIGALALALGYGIYRNREEIVRPALAPPSPRAQVRVFDRSPKRKKHRHRHPKHDHNGRGEYGHRHHS